MTSRTAKVPDADHPIDIEATDGRVVVRAGSALVADTTAALTLREASYPPVQYVPLADVDRSLIQPSDHESYCPFKGDASYFSIPAGGDRSVDAIWTYREPYPAVAAIKDHVAFYPDRVDQIVEQEPVEA
jgi:uncharacterized protein (DUF427 family)